MFTLRPVYRAWLERLFVALSRNLVILFLVALVVSVTMIDITAILPLRLSVAMVVTSVTLFCHVGDLFIVPLAKLMMHVASEALLNLAFALLRQ